MCFSAISLDHLDLEDEDPDFEDLVQTSVLSEIIGKVYGQFFEKSSFQISINF